MQPTPNITPYTIVLAIVTVLTILSSSAATPVVSEDIRNVCALLSVIGTSLMTVLFAGATNVGQRAIKATRATIGSIRSK